MTRSLTRWKQYRLSQSWLVNTWQRTQNHLSGSSHYSSCLQDHILPWWHTYTHAKTHKVKTIPVTLSWLVMKYCTPLLNQWFLTFLCDFLCCWAGHFMQNIPSASVNSVFELWNGCFISEWAICSINVWLAVKYCFWSFEFKPRRPIKPWLLVYYNGVS